MTPTARQEKDSLAPHWSHDIYRVFKAENISMVSYVPDAGHTNLINLCEADPEMRSVVLTTEEEGIAFVSGAYLGGKKGVLLMQSSGVGNCVNMLSLIKTCSFPLLMLVTMRGESGEFNPWQVAMGQGTPAVLSAMGIIVHRVSEAGDVPEVVSSAARLAFNSYCGVAVLLSQRLIGAKQFQR